MYCGARVAPYTEEETRAYIERLSPGTPKQKPAMPKRDLGTISSKVVGVTYDNEDGTSRQSILASCRAGEHLRLEHRPVEQDQNAVAVLRCNGEQLGYLSRELAEDISVYLDAGARIDATITEITGGEKAKDRLGCNLALAHVL